MLPSLARCFNSSALLRCLPTQRLPTTLSSSLSSTALIPIPRPPMVTILRQHTYYDPQSSIELLPSQTSSTSANHFPSPAPVTHTWQPYTRRTSFTSYALPYHIYAAEKLKARREGMVLDPRNHVHRSGTPMKVEVRRETISGKAPQEEIEEAEGQELQSGMELVEGEVAERWIEGAGAVLGLDLGAGANTLEAIDEGNN